MSSGNANAATGGRGRADAAADVRAGRRRARGRRRAGPGLLHRPDRHPVADGSHRGRHPDAGGRPVRVGRIGAEDAATGILTTDSGRKEVLVEHPTFTVAGMAKGAGMLAPDMATMLAFLTTDAAVEPGPLADLLRIAVRDSFNSMTVDGCTSTNDTVVLMASGRAGRGRPHVVVDAVTEACSTLAGQMLADAEGASKIFQVRVTGARSDGEAHRAARKVADSLLVKCSLNGEDPYWGRVASDLGSAGVDFDMDRLAIAYGGVDRLPRRGRGRPRRRPRWPATWPAR